MGCHQSKAKVIPIYNGKSEVKIPPISHKRDISLIESRKSIVNRHFYRACEQNNYHLVTTLLKTPIEFMDIDAGFQIACLKNFPDVVFRILYRMSDDLKQESLQEGLNL